MITFNVYNISFLRVWGEVNPPFGFLVGLHTVKPVLSGPHIKRTPSIKWTPA